MKNKSYVEDVYRGTFIALKNIKRLQQLEDPYEDEDYREPLSIDTTKEVRILLSWGGPEDGFKLTFNQENELLSGVYYRADWGEYKEESLNDDEADTVFNFYMGGSFNG